MKRLLIVLLLSLATGFVWPGPAKLAKDMPQHGVERVDVIIQFAHPPTEKDLDEIRGQGGAMKARLPLIDGGLFSMPEPALKGLANNPVISYVSPDREVTGALDFTAAAVGADLARTYGYDGTGVAVAIIDSGIDEHRDLRVIGTKDTRVVYREDFTGKADDLEDADEYGHGTHVAGIVAGGGANYVSLSAGGVSPIYRGIAPSVQLIDLRVLDENGAGTDSAVIAAIYRAIKLKETYNIRVINLSLGRGIFESYEQDPLCQAVERAWNAGIVVVVSAGNGGRDDTDGRNGYGTINSPANDPYVITVGAMKTLGTMGTGDDLIASYSSKGPSAIDYVVKPDLVAPGNSVVSLLSGEGTLAEKYPEKVVDYFYLSLSGTSMAAPVVSGAAALMLQKEPSLTPDQVKARLMKTASKAFPTTSTTTLDDGTVYNSQYDIFTVGAGYLDIAAALNNSDLAEGVALSPRAVYHPETGEVTLVHDNSVIWGGSIVWSDSVVWSDSIVWGGSVVWGGSIVWSDSVIWGGSIVWSDSVIWGGSIVWSDSVIWGGSIVWGGSTVEGEN